MCVCLHACVAIDTVVGVGVERAGTETLQFKTMCV